jgi:glucosyl-dolichyl phosphate glucuronosyltransferase
MLQDCLDVTIVVCTRNRAAFLARMLHSMMALKLPNQLRWEVLIVDNASEDDTAEVIASYAAVLPVVSVREPRMGLSNARNTGVRHARGRYIVWTDDDVRLHENWLFSYVQAFQAFSDAAVFGGSAIPVLEEPTPAWFSGSQSELRALLAHRDPSSFPLRLSVDGELPFGLNFAIRAREQRCHPYDPMLGVAPGRRRGGEERQVIREILASGAQGYWVPEAQVFHIIPASRQTPQYIKTYYKAQGAADTIAKELGGNTYGTRALLGSIKRAARHYLLYHVRKLDPDPSPWVRHFKRFAYEAGVVEYLISSDRRRITRNRPAM